MYHFAAGNSSTTCAMDGNAGILGPSAPLPQVHFNLLIPPNMLAALSCLLKLMPCEI